METETAEGDRSYPVNHFIREWRKKRELTVNKLAELAEMSPSMISKLERGLVQYTEATLKRIAPVLNTTPAMLIAVNPEKREQIWEFVCKYVLTVEEFEKIDDGDKNILIQLVEMHCSVGLKMAVKTQHLPASLMPDFDLDWVWRKDHY